MNNIYSNDLQKLYIGYFGRPADPSGFNYWLSRVNQSLTLREVSNELSRQEEYTKYILNKSFVFKINKIYLNLFNRKVDSYALNYWDQLINSQEYNISDVVYDILYLKNKNYSISIHQRQEDINILKNKVYVSEIFTNQISKSMYLVNMYQPESISPWIPGASLLGAADFLSSVNSQKVLIDDVNNAINSLSDVPIEILTQPALEIKNISLSIPVHSLENRSLSKRVTKKVLNITGGELNQSENGTNVLALNNINLSIMKGERVGLIGHNGSGKSSFLRLISGIYLPTSGNIMKSVDVYPMLQKTFLTSPELSGIDACKAHYLLNNHTLSGFESFLNEIREFSGLGSYISLPIKTYSEGMSARLIFSILTSSPHDCLAIDEGFGTGDADFCDRAEERMEQFMESASTLFLASHSDELLKQFCNRGLVFSHGCIVYDGPLDAALNYYHTHDYYRKNVIG